jgi:hypothetical protein
VGRSRHDRGVTDLPSTPREVYARLPLDALYAIDHRPLERLLRAREVWEATRDATVRAEAELGRAARASYLAGASWRTIGCALGISRQAAQHRFGERGVAESG